MPSAHVAQGTLVPFASDWPHYWPEASRTSKRRQQPVEDVRTDGLRQVMIEARFLRALDVGVAAVAGERDEHEILVRRILTDDPRQLVAVHAGKTDVDERDVRCARA